MGEVADFRRKPAMPREAELVARQIANLFQAQRTAKTHDYAAQIVAEGFIIWLVDEIVTDKNPEASAREFCRVVLSSMAARLHAQPDGAA